MAAAAPGILLLNGNGNADRIRSVLATVGFCITDCSADAEAAIVVSHDRATTAKLVRLLKFEQPSLPIILLTHGEPTAASLPAGVAGSLHEHCTHAELKELLNRIIQARQTNQPDLAGPALIGNSARVSELRDYIRLISATDCNVLILGETGTGKELVAQCIHANSPRCGNPFVCLNSAAIPDSLIESELFGYERGAFTGATMAQVGKLAYANRGTVFFDEIGDVGMSIQAKVLRAIENRQIYRLGSNRSVDLDIRIVAATNQDLENAMENNRFRRDLYYRINVVRIDLPPLRDRREDIHPLISHFFEHFNKRWNRSLSGLSARAMDVLLSHRWPGNVRELRNVVEALFASLSPQVNGVVDLPPQVMRNLSAFANLEDSERDKMVKALVATQWNKSKASQQLEWSRMTLYRKMHKYRLPMTSPQ